MNALAFVRAKDQTGGVLKTKGKRTLAKAQVVGVIVGLGGGVASGLSGALLMAASWMAINEGVRRWLSNAGSVLLFLVVPLIILGACCMDWMERDKPQRRSTVVGYDGGDAG